MSLRCRSLLLVPLLVLVALPVRAVTIDNLHTASVEVADKGADARREAFRTALERVLVKVSGSSSVLDRQGVSGLVESADALVQQYRYEPVETPADEAPAGEASAGEASGDDADAGADPPRFRLIASFAGGRIERRLEELGIVVWGRQRPEVLVWLGVDDARARRVLGADGDSAAHRALLEAAERRALPVLLPLMDAQDRSRVEFIDISGGFHDTVRAAAERYRAEILLVGHVRRAGGQWRADWTLLGIGDRQAWAGGGADAAAAVATGVDGVTERLAALLAGQGGEQRLVRARVRGVAALGDYARVNEYFRGLMRVESVRLQQATADELVFELAVQGRLDEFERAVELGDVLVRAQGASTAPGEAGGDTPGDGASADGAEAADPAAVRRPELVFRLAD